MSMTDLEMTKHAGNCKAKKNSRKRQVNYSKEEQLIIVDFVKKRNFDLFGKAGYCGVKVEERKQRAWEELATTLRSQGGSEREWRDLKKKWQDLKSRALRVSARTKLTGGGPPTPIDFVSQKVLEAIAPEVREGLSSSQNEAGLGECTTSQHSDDSDDVVEEGRTNDVVEEERTNDRDSDAHAEATGPENTDDNDREIVENLNTVTQILACPPDSFLIHNELVKISGQLATIIDLLRKSVRGKEQ